MEVITAIGFILTWAVASAAELPKELLRPPCVACRQPAGAARELFSEAEWASLEKGEVVIVDYSRTAKGGAGDGAAPRESVAAVIVPRPATEVWAVLADFESRPKIFPNVSESHIDRVENNRAWIRQSVDIFWAKIRYTLIVTLDPASGVMTFVLDHSAPHDIHDSNGSWQVLPHGQAAALLVSRDRVDTGEPLPASIESYLVERSLPKMMSSLRQEVERRARDGAALQ